jgi:hypothetical protein
LHHLSVPLNLLGGLARRQCGGLARLWRMSVSFYLTGLTGFSRSFLKDIVSKIYGEDYRNEKQARLFLFTMTPPHKPG